MTVSDKLATADGLHAITREHFSKGPWFNFRMVVKLYKMNLV